LSSGQNLSCYKKTYIVISLQKWLAQKKENIEDNASHKKPTERQRKKKTTVAYLAISEEEKQRQAVSERAFNQWLDEKQEQSKDEKRMELVRLTEEAQNYVVRDRKQCDKAFSE